MEFRVPLVLHASSSILSFFGTRRGSELSRGSRLETRRPEANSPFNIRQRMREAKYASCGQRTPKYEGKFNSWRETKVEHLPDVPKGIRRNSNLPLARVQSSGVTLSEHIHQFDHPIQQMDRSRGLNVSPGLSELRASVITRSVDSGSFHYSRVWLFDASLTCTRTIAAYEHNTQCTKSFLLRL
ncbi:hypothetical protein KM043_010309 [Ampulex compressa]|nr:hypothetical protein KM043_010309 [Ampulex compressa]